MAVSGIPAEYKPGDNLAKGGWIDATQLGLPSQDGGIQILTFDGKDDVALSDVGFASDFNNQSLYIDTWIYLTAYNDYGRIVGTDNFKLFVTKNGHVKLQLSNAAGVGGKAETPGIINTRPKARLELNRWTRVTARYDASEGVATLCVDGVEPKEYYERDTFTPGN